MNIIKKEVEYYLELEPMFRERKHKNSWIAYLLLKKYHLQINQKLFEDIIVEASSMDRYWRQVLEEHEDLRGSDYKDRQALAVKKMDELGYKV